MFIYFTEFPKVPDSLLLFRTSIYVPLLGDTEERSSWQTSVEQSSGSWKTSGIDLAAYSPPMFRKPTV